jgi:hypothetical protein
MRAYARAFRHPYAAVTRVGKDDKDPAYGTYEIKDAPLGVKVRVIAWHESLGYLAGARGKRVTLAAVEPGGAAPLGFEAGRKD